jgi:hypothetical protein
MRPHVLISMSDGSTTELVPGDWIGRHWQCALPIEDARVSEAHAMVSLRGAGLQLLALRGRFAIDGRPCTKVELRAGLKIMLAPDLTLTIERVSLPTEVMTLSHPDMGQQALSGVVSLHLRPRPRLTAGHRMGAAAWLWTDGARWMAQVGSTSTALTPGTAFVVDGETFEVAMRSLAIASGAATIAPGGVWSPLRLVAHFGTAQIHRDGQPVVQVTGLAARLLSELVAVDGPASWDVVAGELWPDHAIDHRIRRRWDTLLGRLRSHLRDHGIRGDLVRSCGEGTIELVMTEHDVIEDRT